MVGASVAGGSMDIKDSTVSRAVEFGRCKEAVR